MYNATLVHGLVYIVGGRRFEAGKTVQVDQSTKEHLEQYAVDKAIVGNSGRVISECKFKFTPVGAHSVSAPSSVPAPVVTDADDAEDDSAPAPVVSGRPKAR